MTPKEVSRKLLIILIVVCIVSQTVLIFQGKSNAFITILISLCYVVLLVFLIVFIVFKTKNRKKYKEITMLFENFKALNEARQQLSPISNSKKIKDYDLKIESIEKDILNLGTQFINKKYINKKDILKVKSILVQTEMLMALCHSKRALK